MRFKSTNRIAILHRVSVLVVALVVGLNFVSGPFASAQGVQTDDTKGLAQSIKDTAQSIFNTGKQIATQLNILDQETIIAQAFKSSLGAFLNDFAAETGAWIGSGGKGGKPLFITDGWGAYLEKAGDRALGEFVYTVGKGLNDIYQKDQQQRETNAQVRERLNNDPEAYEDYLAMVEAEAVQCNSGASAPNTDVERQKCLQNAQKQAASEAIIKHDDSAKLNYDSCLDSTIERLSATYDASVPFAQIEAEADAACRDNITGGAFNGLVDTASTGIASVINAFTSDLCNPSSLNVSLSITTALQGPQRRPGCNFSQIRDGLDRAIENSNFTVTFNNYWNANENDVGIALTLWDRKLQEQLKAEKEETLKRLEGSGILPKTDGPTNTIVTPGAFVSEQFKSVLDKSFDKDNIYTGTIADAVGTFVNSLLGGLFTRLNDGLIDPSDVAEERFNSGNPFEALNNFTSAPSTSGPAGAKLRFAGLKKVDFSGGGAYAVINALTSCPDSNNPGPTDCVITSNFRDAVIQGVTVQEAIDLGHLDRDLPFGFSGDGLEPGYNVGYPYRSLVILRKYRIVPVGWELAALYIKNFGGQTTTLGTIIDNFENPTSPFYKLVDPNWVLKSPENFCALKGSGPEIASQQFLDGNDFDGDGKLDGPNDVRASIQINRDTNYCADERSCLETNPDGSCKFFGYCTQDKPVWDFQGQTCDPVYNTCRTFQNADGATAAYLANTLDVGDCSANNAGCRWYCTDQNPITGEWVCSETQGNKIHLDRDADECPEGAAGCRRYLSLAEGNGGNLIPNSSFEQFNGVQGDGSADQLLLPAFVQISGTQPQIVANSFVGRSALSIAPGGVIQYVVDTGTPVRGSTYLFSLFSNSCVSLDIQIDPANPQSQAVTINNSTTNWTRSSVFYEYQTSPAGNRNAVTVSLTNNSAAGCTIDAIMLEKGDQLSGYADYQNTPEAFLKTAPQTLNCSTTNPNRSSACDDYTLICSAVEVGCSLYEPLAGGNAIPAIAQNTDFCSPACVGYDVFKQEPTFFETAVYPTYFIPSTAVSCSAQEAGCQEFTNLDAVALGGEGREYYTSLRQCVKPSQGANCQTFFSWVGTESTGYQLVSEQLESDPTPGNGPAQFATPLNPASTFGSCASADDAINNPECREYFDTAGNVFYVHHRLTRTCTENCAPLRATGSDQANCVATGGIWTAPNASVPEAHCLYNAVPEASSQCSAVAAGCREYSGNAATNVRTIFSDDLESATASGYGAGTISTVSITPGGHSIKSSASTSPNVRLSDGFVSNNFIDGKTYEISFWATSPSGPTSLYIESGPSVPGFIFAYFNLGSFNDFAGSAQHTNVVAINNQWNQYTFGPFTYDGTRYNIPETIIFLGRDSNNLNVGKGNWYLDNIRITEVQDSVYAVKDSWNTPLSCDNLVNDPYGAACAAPGICDGTAQSPCRCSGLGVVDPDGSGPITVSQIPFQLGCSEYRNEGEVVTLSSFTNLCSTAAVMCEAMIDTQNSSDFEDKIDFAICTGAIDANGDCTVRRGSFTEVACTPASGSSTCRFTLTDSSSVNAADYRIDSNSVYTPEDDIVYIVNDPKKSCLSEEMGCRALGNPNTSTKVNPTIRISQGGTVSYAEPFTGLQTVEEVYGVPSGVAAQYINGVRITENGKSNVFVYQHQTATSTKFNIIFTHADSGAGSLSATFPTIPLGSSAIVSDDPGEFAIAGGSWNWSATSDGGVIQIPTSGQWRFDIDVTGVSAQGRLGFVSSQGNRIALNDTPSGSSADNIVIEYNPTGFTTDGYTFTTDYILDRPDEYAQTLCTSESLWCEEFTTSEGVAYFKDPRSLVCEWRQSATANEGYKWYKKKTGSSDPDILCPVTDTKTIGTGAPVFTPAGECSDGSVCTNDSDCLSGSCNLYAGTCPIAQNSCSEYIDPTSPFANSIVFNGDFEQNVDGDGIPDGWETSGSAIKQYVNGEVQAVLWGNPAPTGVNDIISQKPIILEPDTIYTVTAKVKKGVGETFNARILLDNCSTFQGTGLINEDPFGSSSPDNSMTVNLHGTCVDILGTPADQIALNIANSSLDTNSYKEFSGRFKTGANTSYGITFGASGGGGLRPTIGHLFEEITIAKTGVYYNLSDSVDDSSCNGVVDLGEGCVPFNKREVAGDGSVTSSLVYDADESIATGLVSANCDNGGLPNNLCDSNVILNVKPDRQCAEWLTCSSTLLENGAAGVQDRCLDFSLCQSIDPKTGECNRTVPRVNNVVNVTLNKAGSAKTYPITLASYLTGYSKAGAEFRENNISKGVIEGMIPLDQMAQIGQPVFIENGDFEIYSRAGQPTGWIPFGGGAWDDQQFAVIYDPVSAQQELADDRLAPEGRGFLRVGSSFTVVTEYLPVSASTDYIISGWINTSNLQSGDGDIRIEEYDITGQPVSGSASKAFNRTAREQGLPYLAAGTRWTYRIAHFRTNSQTQSIRIQLGSSQGGAALGKLYFDNIEIKPALQTQNSLTGSVCVGGPDNGVACTQDSDCSTNFCQDGQDRIDNAFCDSSITDGNCYVTRECRLYPESTSLSCQYFDPNGLTVRGLPGYCIEHDPRNPSICLQWLPVDRIVGDAVDDIGETYADRTPLYMCLNSRAKLTTFFQTGTTPYKAASSGNIGTAGTYVTSQTQISSTIPNFTNIVNVTGTREAGITNEAGYRITETLSKLSPLSGKVGFCTVPNDSSLAGHAGNAGSPYRQYETDCGRADCSCNSAVECTGGAEICATVWDWSYWQSSGTTPGHYRNMRLLWEIGTTDWQYEYVSLDASTAKLFAGDFSAVSIEYTNPSAAAAGIPVRAPNKSYLSNPVVKELPPNTGTYWIQSPKVCNSGQTGAGAPTINPNVVTLNFANAGDLGSVISNPDEIISITGFSNDCRAGTSCQNDTFGNAPVAYQPPAAGFAGWCITKADPLRSGFCTPRPTPAGQTCNDAFASHSARTFNTGSFTPCNTNADCSINPFGNGDTCSNVWYHYADIAGNPNNVAETLVASNVDPNIQNAWIEWWAGHYGADCTTGLGQGLPDSIRVVINYSPLIQECSDVAQVVTPSGEHTAWTGRVSEGSNYQVPDLRISNLSDYKPFGGIVPPEPSEFPSQWDARPNTCVDPSLPFVSNGIACVSSADCTSAPYTQCGFIGKNPLTVETADRSLNAPYQVRAGTPYACTDTASCPIGVCSDSLDVCLEDSDCTSALCCTYEKSLTDPTCSVHPYVPNYTNTATIDQGIEQVRRIFARSYGVWHWNGSAYVETPDKNWLPPSNACPNNIRPIYDPLNPSSADLCGIAPVIGNIKTSSLQSQGSSIVDNTGFINLSFTANVDFNQSPLTRIKVDWGDGNTSIIANSNIRARKSPSDPHQLFHLYSYWDLKGLDTSTNKVTCFTNVPNKGNFCQVIIRMQVQDNWGWCNAYDPANASVLGLYGELCDTQNALKYQAPGFNSAGAVAWTNPGTAGNPISIIEVHE